MSIHIQRQIESAGAAVPRCATNNSSRIYDGMSGPRRGEARRGEAANLFGNFAARFSMHENFCANLSGTCL